MTLGTADWFDKGLRIHLASYYTSKATVYDVLTEYPWFLESYHYIGKNDRIIAQIKENQKRKPEHKIFLDSGAFSMFTKGIEVDVPEYVNFIKNNSDIIEVASVLDGIGDPELTLTNQKKIEDLGVEVLPCFHYGEPISYLEYYLENYSYITLGGMVPISTPDLRQWLDFIWGNYLTDDAGFPIIKVHGFGLTALSLMERYPWFSVDSTSWVLTGRFGKIFYPTPDRPDGKLVISDQSPGLKTLDKHYRTLSEQEKKEVDKRLEKLGFTAKELGTEYWKRDLYNIAFFKGLTDSPITPFVNEEQGLFDAF